MKKFTAKRVAVLGVLLAAASIVFIVESLVPPLLPFAPYVKIGLANCFVLFVIIYFGFAEGVIFLVVKNAISALFVVRVRVQRCGQFRRLSGHGAAVSGRLPEGEPGRN